MKKIFYILFAGMVLTTSYALMSCSEELDPNSIFDTTEYPLDKSSYTFPLDTFCKVNYLEPYNLKYIYKMEDVGTDMDYNLIPASYDKSILLAVLCKYLWYDVYREYVGKEEGDGLTFLKKYSPRIIHVIGSPAYDPNKQTETLGTAEGGLKITLYKANSLNPSDIDFMNTYFFKTMHHEFSHILNQNVNRPTDFDLISHGKYNPLDWNETHDSLALGRGFISNYASSQAREDWVELIANYIVWDTITWNKMLTTASFQWEEVKNVKAEYWEKINRQVGAGLANRDTVGYKVDVEASYADGKDYLLRVVRKSVQRDADDEFAVTDENGNIVYVETQGFNGRTVILQKLQMVREWLEKYFDYDLEKVRMAVQRRQYATDENGDFLFDTYGRFVNNLTYVRPDGTTIVDSLVNQVKEYEKLQQKQD